jgi:hypothetical protein
LNFFSLFSRSSLINWTNQLLRVCPSAAATRAITGARLKGTVNEKLLVFPLLEFFLFIFKILADSICVPRKPKYHSGQIRKTVSLSFSAPRELEDYMNRAAARRGMNRSQWLCWLVTQHVYIENGQMPPNPLGAEPPPQLPTIPTRIKRKKS